MTNQYTDGWSHQEEELLLNYVGHLSFEEISKKLKKRSVSAVERKVERMGIANTQIMSGMVTVHHLSQILGISDKTIYRWADKHDFPIHKKNLRNKGTRSFNYVSVSEFWNWAANHKNRINWFKVEPLVLIPEPDWVEQRRKEDFYKKPPKKVWSLEDDLKVWHLYYTEGLPQKEIAIIMELTQNSIEKRLKRLRESGFAKTAASFFIEKSKPKTKKLKPENPQKVNHMSFKEYELFMQGIPNQKTNKQFKKLSFDKQEENPQKINALN